MTDEKNEVDEWKDGMWIRDAALTHAIAAAKGDDLDETEIVAAAEVFLAFLRGQPTTPVDRGRLVPPHGSGP